MTERKGVLADEAFVARVRDVTGLVPRNETLPDDLFLVSYPKSGTTWLQNLLAGAAFGLNLTHVPYTVIADLIPGRSQRFYRRYTTPMIFKTHLLPRPRYRRVIYLLRDGRDVMVSYFHYLQKMGRADDLLSVVQDDAIWPCQWHTHVQCWLMDDHAPEVDLLLVKYEDLQRDALAELKRICAFAGLEREPSWLASVVEQASFEKMRAREERFGMHIKNWSANDRFMRRGQVGSYRDEMPAEVLAAFMAQAEPVLRAVGYG